MGAPPELIVHRDATLLARAVAARLITRLVDAQAARDHASLVLTGGGIGIASLRALRESSAVNAVDWTRLTVWWGDERFVPAADPERNERQAREALLDHVPVRPGNVLAMPPSDGPDGNDPDAAADRYARLLAAHASPEDHGPVPRFDVLLLGVGPDGHVASIFPESPAAYDERTVVAVRGAPKPPPVRLTMTFRAIRAATEVWIIAAGEEKAGAVHLALSGAGPLQVPAAGPVGRSRTLWLLDRAAASKTPEGMRRPASP